VDVPSPGANRTRAVFGALEWSTGRWLYQITQRKRTGEFIAFLEHRALAYADRAVLVVLDNASIHHAHAVERWLGEHMQVQLLFLPAYSGHRHHPVEKVWWRRKEPQRPDRGQPLAWLHRRHGRRHPRLLRHFHLGGCPPASGLSSGGRLLSLYLEPPGFSRRSVRRRMSGVRVPCRPPTALFSVSEPADQE
jgi:DDE superfamily endonuclease